MFCPLPTQELISSPKRLTSVVIMIFGVTLFLRLLQTLVRPHKVRYACPDCGLQRHGRADMMQTGRYVGFMMRELVLNSRSGMSIA